MTPTEPVQPRAGETPLDRVKTADDLMWSATGCLRHVHDRDVAVNQALAAGVSANEVAEVLHVRPADVQRMSRLGSGDPAPGEVLV